MNVNCVTKGSVVLQKFGDEKPRGKMREFELQKLTSRGSVPLICIKITGSSGKESNLTVNVTDTVNAVKDRALGGEYSKESHLYKLILAKSCRELIDEKTLDEENVQENGKCRLTYCFFNASDPVSKLIINILVFVFSFPDELILFRKRHNASCDTAEKVRLAFYSYLI